VKAKGNGEPLRVVKDMTEVEDDIKWYYMHVKKPQIA
jgi:hypothetical protein